MSETTSEKPLTADDAFREASPSGGVEFSRGEDAQARTLSAPVPTASPDEKSPLNTPWRIVPGGDRGQGVQWVSSASGPVAESLGKPISESNIPGFGTQAAASMATEPEQRR